MSFIKYRGEIGKILFEPLYFEYDDNNVISLKIYKNEKEENYIYFHFTFKDKISDLESAKKLTKKYLNDFTNLLLYLYGYSVKHLEVHEFTDTIFLKGSFDYVGTIEDNFEKIKDRITDRGLLCTLEENISFRLYKSAMEISDPFGKFMFLYSIIYDIFGNQAKLESYIKSTMNNVETLKRVKTNLKNEEIIVEETIFTWIRNHIGHTNKLTDIELIRGQVMKNTANLSNLVLKAIFS
ncbi:hypothetical protein DZB84_01405 [Bacillus sp. HNG]|uniref:methylamine utilization protein MauJ n=1 Tax=Bacillus sp. HNG TaxID=2293325 RepID=UPI000E2ED9AC|nr:methylamine utilization protein MauJ [Bacillus sp. HNG]RFB18938.1 hypothetical protein DZB84_01405 [Bacillus sp. HNG]